MSRMEAVKEGVTELLEQRDGLMCGICNGFQALIKLGLVPYGKIIDTDENCPTLTYNTIGRHQSRIVRTRVASNKSPWLALTEVGDVYTVPISHGEGRFLASEELIRQLAANGQIATQYVDASVPQRLCSIIRTIRCMLLRASPLRMDACLVKWDTASVSAMGCIETSPAIMTSACLKRRSAISNKQEGKRWLVKPILKLHRRV